MAEKKKKTEEKAAAPVAPAGPVLKAPAVKRGKFAPKNKQRLPRKEKKKNQKEAAAKV